MVNDYSRHCEMNLDLGISKMNAEYCVVPGSKRVGNQTQKMISSREGSLTRDIMKSIIQGEDIWKKQSWMALLKESSTK